MKTNWIVFTGGPCSGKTTVLNELAIRGFFTIPEVARVYSSRLLARNENPRTNEAKFQQEVFELKSKLEVSLNKFRVSILDRALPDSIAFTEGSLRKEIFDKLAAKERVYSKVLYFQQLENYENDDVRIEVLERAAYIHTEIWKVYCRLGYKPIEIPLMGVEERTEFVLSLLNP